ncbi:MAG: TldD/PmbA family protein [Myxococcota bacterium]
MGDPEKSLQDQAAAMVEVARSAGADIAEVVMVSKRDLGVRVRKGALEHVEEASSRGAGLRVFVGPNSGSASTSDLTPDGIRQLVDNALEVAKLSEADPDALPPDAELLARTFPDLDLLDASLETFGADEAKERALAAEGAALAVDPRLTNSDGAECGRTVGEVALATSGGFVGSYRSSFVSLSVQPLAEDEGGKKRGGAFYDARRHLEDLMGAEAVGREAAGRTLAKLGPRKLPSAEVPVVFHPEAGRALLSALLGCVSGNAVYRRSTYLADREGSEIASPLVTLLDDPLLPRGPGSRPFDGEGLASRPNKVVDGGRLEMFLCDTYSARRLGRTSTGSAARGLGGRPSVAASNFRMIPGDIPPEHIVRDVQRGLLVTSMMGFGFNPVTGDFSRGAEGFWIEGGQVAYPVSEITVSANFDDLWRGIDAVGDDPDDRSAVSVPTFRVRRMTISGS